MDIPGWLIWVALALFLVQALGLASSVRRWRRSAPGERSGARLDLLDMVAGLMLMGGLLLSLTVAGSWVWLLVTGFVLMVGVYTVKGLRLLRARRHPTT
ncbi:MULTISPECIES: hypothetical protein [Streptomyces]|uniref:DUF2516 family protein n=1 Tax=Streptomyces cyaneofuscatus TaxID=66883 RepID=A0ABZ1F755_9ACTN|nr:hypothetical protein [Streptomyces cyaneofuscatus]WSB12060.1 hypothetical protein OG849_34730 [Streptomyces cyaneofuscatus]WSD44408.1 hypothetical protein OG857_00670 [Streptomyces cyaneofuscatus]WTA87603.1 hypothetical protein OG323_00750 [Streptomyces cyaneofuscatus]